MTLPLFLQTVVTLLFAGKFLIAIKFMVTRAASWMGVGFFYKKGRDSGQTRFYWVAFLIWLISWGIVLYFSPKIVTHTVTFFKNCYNSFTQP